MFCQSIEGLIAWAIILTIIVAVLLYINAEFIGSTRNGVIIYGAGALAWLVIVGMFVLSNSGLASCDKPELRGLFPGSVAAAAVTPAV